MGSRMAAQRVDRFVLRLAILCEYYKAEHATTGLGAEIAGPAIVRMDVPEVERETALRYLAGSGLLLDTQRYPGNEATERFPSSISHTGIDFVERAVCEASFDSIRGRLKEGESLDGYTGRLEILGRILPNIIGGDRSEDIVELVMALVKNACRLIPGFAGP